MPVWRNKNIDYVFQLADIEWWYFVIAAGLFLLVWALSRKWYVGALVGYLFLVIAVTILSREPFDGRHFQPELFWSYRVPRLREQIIMNVVAFVPVGVLASRLMGWKSILFAAGVSACIETVQLVSKVGLFEFDDIIHNCLGAAIGFIIYVLIRKIVKSRDKIEE